MRGICVGCGGSLCEARPRVGGEPVVWGAVVLGIVGCGPVAWGGGPNAARQET